MNATGRASKGFSEGAPPARGALGPILALWLALYAWRPFRLGLYYDDWWWVTSSWPRKFALMRPRPAQACWAQFFVWICGAHAWAWQASAALLALASALALREMLRRFLQDDGSGVGIAGADWAALAWLGFPWMLGTEAWPSCSLNLFSMLGCCLGTALFFGAMEDGENPGLLPGCLLLALGGLSYEAFFGVPLLLLAGFVVRASMAGPGRRRLSWGRPVSAAALVELGLFLYNRWSSSYPGARRFYASWLPLGWANLRAIKDLTRRFWGGDILFALLIVAVAGGAWLSWENGRLRLFLAGVACAGVGLLASAFLYARAGYHIAPWGMDSRTTMAPSLWFALLLGVVWEVGGRRGTWGRRVLAGVLVLFVAAASVGTVEKLGDWRRAWVRENEVLDSFPRGESGLLRRGDLILAQLPYFRGDVPDFQADGDLGAALESRVPALASLGVGATVARAWDWRTVWAGGLLRQTGGQGDELWALPALRVWLWDPARGIFRLLKAGETLGPLPKR